MPASAIAQRTYRAYGELLAYTMPEPTLLAFADHGLVKEVMPPDGGDAESVLTAVNEAGIDLVELATRLQREGADAFGQS